MLILFAVSNREPVALTFWPFFRQGIELPFFLAVLVPVAVAFLLGWIIASFRAWTWRSQARRRGDKAESLSAEVGRLRAQQSRTEEERKRAAETARLESASKAARSAAEQEVPARSSAAQLTPAARPPAPAIEGRPH